MCVHRCLHMEVTVFFAARRPPRPAMSSCSSTSSWLSVSRLPECAAEEVRREASPPPAVASLKSHGGAASTTSSSSFTPAPDVNEWMCKAEEAMSGLVVDPSGFEASTAAPFERSPPPTPPAGASRGSSLAAAVGTFALTAALYALSPAAKASPPPPCPVLRPAPLLICPACPMQEPPPTPDGSPLIALQLMAGLLLVRGSSLLRGSASKQAVGDAEPPLETLPPLPPLPLKKKKIQRARKSDLGGWAGGGSCWSPSGKRRSVRLLLASTGAA